MAWYNNLFREKLNPSQPDIGGSIEPSKEPTISYKKAYSNIEIVNRGVNMIVDDTSSIPAVVGQQYPGEGIVSGVRKVKVDKLINWEPNPFQDISTFKRNILVDYLIDGNIFIYWDGLHIYHLPANKVSVKSSETTYVDYYEFNGDIKYKPSEIIHIQENSFDSLFRGTSRLRPARRTMELMLSMRNFQDNFFKNGAVPGLVIKSPNTLSEKIKSRMIQSWMDKYNPAMGGKRPLVLDGGLEIDSITDVNFQELDFQGSITANEDIILKALGVPPILLDSGNNANLRPNLRMYYIETILPIVLKVNRAYERFFGFYITEDVTEVPAMQPELRDQSQYYTSLVNTGVITPNEARDKLGFEEDTDAESGKLRVPANIAGSAANPNEGGKPQEGDDEK